MALIALLSAHDRPGVPMATGGGHAGGLSGGLLDFGGQKLVEYQARLAVSAGAQAIVILVDSASAELARIVDRVMAERDCEIALVQDMTALTRSLTPSDRVLLLAENLVLPADALGALLAVGTNAMLTLPSVPSTARYERIDAQTVWAGALCLPGAAVLSTLDMLGEWDLALTLLRRAVQDGARRISLSPELVMDGHLALLDSQASADIALSALSEGRPTADADQDAGIATLFAPIARPIVREVVRRQIEPVQIGSIGLVCAVLALALAAGAWMIPAHLFMLLGLGAADVARRAARVTLRDSGPLWRDWLVKGAALLMLAWLGFFASGGHLLAVAGAWTPVALIGLFAIIDAQSSPGGLWQGWSRIGIAGPVLLMLLGLILGMGDAAFALLGLLTLAAVAIRLFPAIDNRV